MKADLRCDSLFGSGDGVFWIGFVGMELTAPWYRFMAVSNGMHGPGVDWVVEEMSAWCLQAWFRFRKALWESPSLLGFSKPLSRRRRRSPERLFAQKPTAPLVGGGLRCARSLTHSLCCRRMPPRFGRWKPATH